MRYDVFVLIAQNPSTGESIALTYDSENEARTRYERMATLGEAELIRIVRNPNRAIEGAIYLARNFTIEAL